jgi:hypothetical protein
VGGRVDEDGNTMEDDEDEDEVEEERGGHT